MMADGAVNTLAFAMLADTVAEFFAPGFI